MKLFEFKPKLVSCLKNYSKETFMADLMAGVIVGIVALPLAIAFGIASGFRPKRYYHRYHCRIHHFSVGEEAKSRSADRQELYRHYLRHHPTIWRSRTDCRHAHGGCSPYIIRSVQAGGRYQIYSLSHYRRFHQRYRRYHFTTQIADIFGLSFGDEKYRETLSGNGWFISVISIPWTGGIPS